MKQLCVVILFVTALAPFSHGAEGERHLFILSGQSNMDGIKPQVAFTPTVSKKFGKDNVTVVKDSLGGRPIRCWYKKWVSVDGKKPQEPNGKLYDRLMKKVRPAIEGKKFKTVTFVWMQGERDANERLGEVYLVSLKGLWAQLVEDLGRKDINFVVGRLSDFDMKNKQYRHWTMVREIQVKFAKENKRVSWIDTDDLNGEKDDLHYTKAGYKALGKRFAEKAIELIENDGKKETDGE